MRAGGGLDLAELCIVAGKTCWVVFVDGLVMNADGSVVDALSIAAKVRCCEPHACMVQMTQMAGHWHDRCAKQSMRSRHRSRKPP